MGYGTGVHHTTFAICFLRAVVLGVTGALSLYLEGKTGLPQHVLVGTRSLGFTLGPILFSGLVGRAVWSGNSRLLGLFGLFLMSCCEAMMPQVVSPGLFTVLFFFMGFATSLLDMMCFAVLATVHGEHGGLPFSIFHAVNGVGGMLAPHLVVATPNHCWEILAVCHGTLGLALLVRWLQERKPRNWKAWNMAAQVLVVVGVEQEMVHSKLDWSTNSQNQCKWKAKIRGTTSMTSLAAGGSEQRAGIPWRVMAGGIAFIFFTEAAESAMGNWAFLYALTTLRQPSEVASLFPDIFYVVFTTFRVLCAALLWQVDIRPCTLVHICAWVTLLGAGLLHVGSSWVTNDPEDDYPVIPKRFLLVGISLIALGVCPQIGMMQASLGQHGRMNSRQLGSYTVAIHLGTTMGLFFPGVVSLPVAEFMWAACAVCIINAFVRDHAWHHNRGCGKL